MRYLQTHIRIFAFFAAFAACGWFGAPAAARAATLYFDAEGTTVGVGQPFKLGLLVDAARPVNAFEVTIALPPGVEAADASDGNSVISYWVQRPTFDESRHTVSFSGIVPGGYYGKGATLATLTLVADRPGKLDITYAPDTRAILNSPNSDPDMISTSPISLRADPSKQRIDNPIPDAVPPEPFSPALATSSSVFGGAWAAYFQAEDKGSGMYGYEAAEASYLTGQYGSLVWTPAESPYRLHDQTLSSYVYIRATDKMGNARVEILPPVRQSPWQTTSAWSIIALTLAILASAWLFIKVHSYRSRSRS